MVAIGLAVLIFVATVVWTVIKLWAAGMSDSPSAASEIHPGVTFVVGTVIALIVGWSHWWDLSW